MTLTTLQQEGLLDPQVTEVEKVELIYCLVATDDPYGADYLEAAFVTEERAKARKAVLEAEQNLRNAKLNEEYQAALPTANAALYQPEETFWWIRAVKLIR